MAGSAVVRSVMQAVRAILAVQAADDGLVRYWRVSRALITAAIVVANVIGAVIVIVLLEVILPRPPGLPTSTSFGGSTGVAVVSLTYVVLAVAVGIVSGWRLAAPVIGFYRAGRAPDEADRRAVLRLPLLLLRVQALLWGLAVIVFGLVAFRADALFGFEVAITVLLGGIPTASLAYLLTQRLLRIGIAVVLADAPPRRREVPGVRPRALLVWALGVVPIGGVITLVSFAPFTDVSVDELVRSVAVLSAVAIAVGAMGISSFARAVADPLQLLRDAFARIEQGELDVEVPVFDATEVGYATAGFNRMAAGLRERERLRDLFGRQVGTDVARRAMEEGVRLGGEERIAAALFIDIIDSTGFAAERSPTDVVRVLNDFFEVVVRATQEHGGLVNKFLGDAALCIFGAPLAQDDPAGAALAAAREMAARLLDGPLQAGIGVAVGAVVAGNVGSAQRYEYTVIGDPVNEAARLTELAKQRPGRLVASWEAVEAADEDERAHWCAHEELTLRGRRRPTRLAQPAAPLALP